MKKWICGALACLMLLTACDQEPEREPAFPATVTTQAILDSEAFSEQLEPLDYEIAAMLFGFESWCGDLTMFENSVIYYSTGATSELCAVFVVGDEYYGGDMAAATESIEEWLEYQIQAEADYRPAEVPKLENAILEERDNSILLVVAADWEKAEAAIPAE